MTKASTILMTLFAVFFLVVGPISVTVADQPTTQKVETAKEESKGVWGWIKDKAMWVGTSIKDGAVYVGSAIGNGFSAAWHWIWPSKKDDKKDDTTKATTPTMKMSDEARPMSVK
ncbi:MAG: hypothetical protein Q8K37_02410 [Alphaproteobacteria bacterium]|nr:hypothetical protein [Alphaproteobacteria bacterium]